jgi:hypothetical protein
MSSLADYFTDYCTYGNISHQKIMSVVRLLDNALLKLTKEERSLFFSALNDICKNKLRRELKEAQEQKEKYAKLCYELTDNLLD